MNGGFLQKQAREDVEMQGASGWLSIDLGALRRNYAKLSSLAAPACVAAVVKANAYGLGVHEVSKALHAQGCRHFFVAQFGEAAELRPDLPRDAQIFVLNGLQPGSELACAEAGFVPVINSLEQLRNWLAAARVLKRMLPAVLQFDTGMSRLGIPAAERAPVAAALKQDGNIDILFIMSHLANAEDRGSGQNADQLAEMNRIAAEFTGFDICFANSGGIFLGPGYHGVLVRPGIALYGDVATDAMSHAMEPVVSLDVSVIQTRTVPAGTRVGYGGAYITSAETRIATLAAGYADGLPRSLSGRGAVYHGGVRLPLIGPVSMDSITVDVTALPEGTLALGSRVEVIGPHQTLEDLARAAGTISYEILTGLGRRYDRQYR